MACAKSPQIKVSIKQPRFTAQRALIKRSLLIGVGLDADLRAKLLIYQAMEGSILGSNSLLMRRAALRAGSAIGYLTMA